MTSTFGSTESDRNGRVVAEGGFGLADLARETPATEHTVWPVASLTLPIDTRYRAPEASDVAQYAGAYRFRKGSARVWAGDGGVVVRTPSRYDGPTQTLRTRQVGPNTFMTVSRGQCIPFVRDGSGRVVRFLHSGYAYERRA